MTSPLASEAAPFGRVLTAMVTPFDDGGAIDLDAVQRLATYLVDHGNDGIVVSGTTGESPTTTTDEDGRTLAAVIEAVGGRASVVAGVGTNDTRHSVELAEQARKAGADGLLLVTPYYNKPPQSGVIAHVNEVVRAGDGTPTMVYDIPGRAGIQIAEETYVELVKNPLVVAVKDAVGDFERGAWLLRETGIKIYSGDDALTLPWLSIGASGVVGVTTHVAGDAYADMVRAFDAGDVARAQELNRELVPVVRAIMGQTQGAIAAKAAMALLGVIPNPDVRLPLTAATDEQVAVIHAALVDFGLLEN
ncbi:MAG TPA: 4-hydroxy-tetrahydrodipicolinate synthase [Aeromicrobium sp.]|nr:4-hydroxy-tetrahydrodipicolinate synthase [Aeromicrobium sp.]HKY58420.1 4-hydroxy-tetrahydrodipicolinate synthase [Aeromicrobium sp.]